MRKKQQEGNGGSRCRATAIGRIWVPVERDDFSEVSLKFEGSLSHFFKRSTLKEKSIERSTCIGCALQAPNCRAK